MNPVSLSILPSRSRSRIVRGRRNLLVAAGALLWGLSGCTLPEEGDPVDPGDPSDPGVPQGRQVRTAFQVSMGDGPLGVFVLLDETANVAGLFDGAVTLSRNGQAVSLPVVATMDGEDELSVGAHEDILGYTWSELRIALRDANGDGTYESGSGHIDGARKGYYSMEVFAGDFEAAPDAFRPAISARPEGDFTDALMPWQPLVIEFGQPVPVDYISSFVVLADGEPVTGSVQVDEYQLYRTSVQFVPETFYPAGSELRVVPMGMQNALGTQVEGGDATLPVIADAGPANANLGFEQGLAGWSTVGEASVVESYGDVRAVEGAAMAVLRSGGEDGYTYDSRLIGAIDVPADASELDLSLAVLTEDWLPTAVTVRLYREGYYVEPRDFQIYEFGHEAEAFVPCECAELGLTRRSGTFRRQVSLAAFRGERVYIEFLLNAEQWRWFIDLDDVQALGVLPIPPPAPPVQAALIIDDIQIR